LALHLRGETRASRPSFPKRNGIQRIAREGAFEVVWQGFAKAAAELDVDQASADQLIEIYLKHLRNAVKEIDVGGQPQGGKV
jgi:hypothetical protein